jgi:hypothetical protein
VLTVALEDQDVPLESPTNGDMEPEYTFEGFVVEFSTKVVLIPAGPPGGQPPESGSGRHG